MFLFGKSNKKSETQSSTQDDFKVIPPWKTKEGVYECHSERCPDGLCGSYKCPLDIQTEAIPLLGAGDFKRALELMTKVVAIAPDFPEGWFNLGVCYGNLGDHISARDAFRTALSFNPKYAPAIRALATAESKITGVVGVESIRYMDVLEALIQLATKLNDVHGNTLKSVPELMPYAGAIGREIMIGLEKLNEERNLNYGISQIYETAVTWSMLAGVGAVLEWKKDWLSLKSKGLYEKLCEQRGIYAMDEYVLELLTGEKYDSEHGIKSEACELVNAKLYLYSKAILAKLNEKLEEIPEEKAQFFMVNSYLDLSKAAYLFGMGFALEQS